MDVNAAEFQVPYNDQQLTHDMSSMTMTSCTSGASPELNPSGRNSLNSLFPNFHPDYLCLKTVAADPGSRARTSLSVTSLTFDTKEELLWSGNAGGHVTSYYGLDMVKYTSFQVVQDLDIRAQLTGDYGILSLAKDSLRMSLRRGLTVFHHLSDLFKDMYCMCHMDNTSLIAMGGQQGQLIEFELERRKEIRVTEIGGDEGHGCVILRSHPKLLCCGDTSGKITLRDKNTLKVQHVFNAHSGQLSDFDVRGNQLVTCGYSKRSDTHFNVDRFLMVYDLRMMKALNPIQMINFNPHLLKFVPIYSSKFCVVSQSGSFQLLDTNGSSSNSSCPPFLHQIDFLPPGSSITSFDVSQSSQALAFADDSGLVHLFGASNEVAFNKSSQETEFPDQFEEPSLAITDTSTPFSVVAPFLVPNLVDKDSLANLLSSWPKEFYKKVHRVKNPIDGKILATMKITGPVGYAQLDRGQKLPPLYLDTIPDLPPMYGTHVITEPDLLSFDTPEKDDKDDKEEEKEKKKVGQEKKDEEKKEQEKVKEEENEQKEEKNEKKEEKVEEEKKEESKKEEVKNE